MKQMSIHRPPTATVLGVRLDVTNYDRACERVCAIAKSGAVATVAAANTHLVAEAASSAAFAGVLRAFDIVLPDGMPLVWTLRLDGHQIEDRVYGPYFMEHVLVHCPAGMKHYFFGGTAHCLEKLQGRARELNPQIQISGAVSPPFGMWDEGTESGAIDAINASGADLIWVALGGVKQETWIAKNRHRFKRGVFLAVGDAFALVAGLRPYAPAWVQRAGLTWLFRLAQEPRRLLSRYLRYNTRFAVALLKNRLKLAYGER
jgi:N-acetylglucosaminyldiphosphoundecaprenol N-acetyl-beta-D-mannosaminyltransferase